MSYTCSRPRPGGHPSSVFVGHHVTDEHPLAKVERWNRGERERSGDRAGPGRVTVLNWYAPLSPEEEAALAAAGVDLTAVDETASVID